jgi:hypothetical protein
MAEPRAYTVSHWRVTRGQEGAFREAWADLGRAFACLGRPSISGTLLQHRTDPTLFISFGPWNSPEDIDAMRRDASAQDAFLRVVALCDHAEQSAYSTVELINVEVVRPRQASATASIVSAV